MNLPQRRKGMRDAGVYIHIPFCLRKCPYCAFNSIAVTKHDFTPYLNAVLKEIALLGENVVASLSAVTSLYFGGGTPSLLDPSDIKTIVENVGNFLFVSKDTEVTLEVNPAYVDPHILEAFLEAGVNRLSLGIQSFQDNILRELGRVHTATDSEQAYVYAVEAGFKNIGIDLIFGIEGQSIEGWFDDLARVKSLMPKHVSVYALTIEEGTPFYSKYGKYGAPVPEDEFASMYSLAVDLLKRDGYERYEISNFSLPGFRSRHNESYWTNIDYFGFGAGAHSYTTRYGWGKRWWNVSNPEEYMNCISERGEAVAGSEWLCRKDAILESIFLGLRISDGINIECFENRFGSSPKDYIPVDRLGEEGLILLSEGSIRLSAKGVMLSDEIFSLIRNI